MPPAPDNENLEFQAEVNSATTPTHAGSRSNAKETGGMIIGGTKSVGADAEDRMPQPIEIPKSHWPSEKRLMHPKDHWLIEGKRDPGLGRWVVDLIYQEGSPNDPKKPCFVVYLDEEFSIQWYYSPSTLALTGPVSDSDHPNHSLGKKTQESKHEESKLDEQNPDKPRGTQPELGYAKSPSQADCFPNDFNLLLNDIVHLETLSNNLRRPALKWYHPARLFFPSTVREYDRGLQLDDNTCDFSRMKRRHSQLRSTRRLIAEALGRTYEWIDGDPGEQDPRSIAARSAILTAQNFLKARSNDLGRSYLLSGALWATAFCLILGTVLAYAYANSYDGKREQFRRNAEFASTKIVADVGLRFDEIKKAFPQADSIIQTLQLRETELNWTKARIIEREKRMAEEKENLTRLRDAISDLNTKLSGNHPGSVDAKVPIGTQISELSSKIDGFVNEDEKALSWMNRDSWNLLMYSITGAFGAMLSLLMSASTRDYDMGAGRPIHLLEGVTRIIVGVLGASFITIAINSGFLLGFLTQESATSFSASVSDSNRLMWLHYLFAFIAGVSERFVPSFISVVEAQTQSSKQPG